MPPNPDYISEVLKDLLTTGRPIFVLLSLPLQVLGLRTTGRKWGLLCEVVKKWSERDANDAPKGLTRFKADMEAPYSPVTGYSVE